MKSGGKISMDEKVNMVLETGENEDQAAHVLKQSLTKVEHSNIWNQHATHVAKNPQYALVDAEGKPLGKQRNK
ncbi:MAG: hypothetical protein ACKPKO_66015 [Candidatus Fonsibacter sp.]